jgi:hypothetical protein
MKKLFLLQLIFAFTCINLLAQKEYFIMSTANLQYIDKNGDSLIITVQLRTIISRLNIYYQDEGYCGAETGSKVYNSDFWEIVLNPNTNDESIFNFEYGDEFVEGTLHDGQLYTDMFEGINEYDRLFLYYFDYGDCSNEFCNIFYYDVSSKKLQKVRFYFDKNDSDDGICINQKEDYELMKITSGDCNNNDKNCPLSGLKTITFAQGVAVAHIYLWKFDEKDKIFQFYRHTKKQY